MKTVKELGIEKELFLLDWSNTIAEPKRYGFPRDEFEFLVELRSVQSDDMSIVLDDIRAKLMQCKIRAKEFNLRLLELPFVEVSAEWVKEHWRKHNLNIFADLTKNIYNTGYPSHYSGILDLPNYRKMLMAGMHVHFSARDADTGIPAKLPVKLMVRMMDLELSHDVRRYGRNLGEWEPKEHGFEYRSLPCNADIYRVLKTAFKILRNLK